MIGQAFCRLPCILVIKKASRFQYTAGKGPKKILTANPTITHTFSNFFYRASRAPPYRDLRQPTMPPAPSTPAADVRALIDLTHTTQTLLSHFQS